MIPGALNKKSSKAKSHMFVIPAFGESPYLEDCIASLLQQTVKSRILLATSAPSGFIYSLAEKYDIPVAVNKKRSGIASDWSFAYNSASTDFVTLAHQDDIYSALYTESCLQASKKNPLIVFTDYVEKNKGRIHKTNLLLLVKRLMLAPFFLFNRQVQSVWAKKLMISLGNPISCPTIMYHKKQIGTFHFNPSFSMNLDWEATFRIAKMKGSFCYVDKPLVVRRIHKDAESTSALKDYRRQQEDRVMFELFWPKYVVKMLLFLYSAGYKSGE